MNLARSRDPELRPSTNTSVGRVTVLDEDEALLQKTDRTGFVENEAFLQLKQFSSDAMEWMHNQRLTQREERRHRRKSESSDQITKAVDALHSAIATLAPLDRWAVSKAAKSAIAAADSENRNLRQELGLYQTLASVGTAVSVFAHEIEGPATDLTNSAKAVERRARKALAGEYESTIGAQISAVKRSAQIVSRFATLPLALLRRSKRRSTRLDVNKSIQAAADLFKPYLDDAQIDVKCVFSDDDGQIRASVAALEAIVSNLLTNAVKAFNRQGDVGRVRQIVVRTSVTSEKVLISVLDNGPGVPKKLGDRVWLPGVTSDENGTGLGLTIVRDTATELGASVSMAESGELGGAEFAIAFPRAG